MANKPPYKVKTIAAFHKLRGLPAPAHPLISVIDYASIKHAAGPAPASLVLDFYSVALKRNIAAKIKYGQQEYDFDEGLMFFISPGQVFSVEVKDGPETERRGWILLVHPDFLWSTPLAKGIRQYNYFDYAVNEALFLSEKEEDVITGLIQNIRQECQANLDRFSQDIIVAQLELLLRYAERFYQRQFLTRKISSHKILDRLEEVLAGYFNNADAKGLPTVQYIAEALAVSPNYLSGLLKTVTGKSTQQHIHDKLIQKAKEKLSATGLSVSEIAYELGFEHPQSFSKLFKTKTALSLLAFRQSFN